MIFVPYILRLLTIEAVLLAILYAGLVLFRIFRWFVPYIEPKDGLLPAWFLPFYIGFVIYHFPAILFLTRAGKQTAGIWAIVTVTFVGYGVIGFCWIFIKSQLIGNAR